VHERIHFISHQKKQILLVDFSNCSAVEVEKLARAAPETVTAQPRGSVLVLSDFTGASFNEEAMRAMKESAVFNKPYIKKSAWVGAENLPPVFEKNLKDFSRREFTTFKSREAALAWLIED
jgi:mannose/fructose-specific phosphotransferase system component IIA